MALSKSERFAGGKSMKANGSIRASLRALALLSVAIIMPGIARAELLAMFNYESKVGQPNRKEGIAVIDVDPTSPTFNKVIIDTPLPPDYIAHHIFYNKDVTKAYVTSLGHSELYVYDLSKFPDAKTIVAVPDCKVGEDVTFSGDGKRWYLSCMGSSNIIVGDAQADKQIGEIKGDGSTDKFIKYPHGVMLNDEIDRILVTSTVNPQNLKEAGETVAIIEASTGKILSTQKVSEKPSPSGAAPVEIAFVPNRRPPIAYIDNMYGGALWTATWVPETKDFAFQRVFDFAGTGQGLPLEMGFNKKGDRLYVTTAKPGAFNIFDIADLYKPKLLATISTAGGAHHFAFSPDNRYAFVQNSFLNLPEMDDGSVSVIDMDRNKVIATVDVLKNRGLNPNCIMPMPKWYKNIEY
jgi:DNA-binding beta-propeller fold protein YncE